MAASEGLACSDMITIIILEFSLPKYLFFTILENWKEEVIHVSWFQSVRQKIQFQTLLYS